MRLPVRVDVWDLQGECNKMMQVRRRTSRGGSTLVNRPCEYRVGGCPIVVVLISNKCSLHTDLFSIFAMAKVVDEGQEVQVE